MGNATRASQGVVRVAAATGESAAAGEVVAAADGVPGPHLLVVTTVAGTLEAFLAPYAEHYRSLGWKVDAAAKRATENPAIRDAFDDLHELPISRSLLDLRGLFSGYRAIARTLRSKPDIVHVHTPIASFLTRFAVRRMPAAERPAVVYTAHGFHFFKGGSRLTNALFGAAERLAGRWTDRLVVINEEDFEAALRLKIVPRRKLVWMPGIGVDTATYERSRVSPQEIAGIRERFGLPEGPLFVVTGELNRNKRQRDVVAALASLPRSDVHVALAGGPGTESARVEALARSLGVADRVHALGFVREIRPLICSSTALILASSREGLARSIMEALSLEIPVIASTARGNRELLGDGAGILYDIGDVAALAGAMERILDDPDAARAMAAAGRRKMVGTFELSKVIAMHDAMYDELLAERATRVAALAR